VQYVRNCSYQATSINMHVLSYY